MGLQPPVALGDLSWPRVEHHPIEAVERDITEATYFDVAAFDTLTVAVRRRCIELARAPIVAVAVPVYPCAIDLRE